MPYRFRQIAVVKYGHFGEYLSGVKKLEKIAESRGWAPSKILAPLAGQSNEIVQETEYDDLATLQREGDEFYKDAEAFEIFRAGAAHIVEGSARTELLEYVPMDFPGSD